MGICVISALLLVIPPLSSSSTRGVFPVLFQQPSFKGYADSPRPSALSRLHVSEGASTKFLLKKVEPEYPHEAKGSGAEDPVIFRIIVGTDGRVQEIYLRRGKPLLLQAAARALSTWRYKPYTFNGSAVEIETFATIRFRLPNKHR